jgi:diadenosine tetraphosphatase ApaH/serine/threonine PP2A family protein phosphatase
MASCDALDAGRGSVLSEEDADKDMEENKRHSSPAILGRGSSSEARMPCKFPNCKNKAASNFDVCLIHAKNRRHSVLQVENITRNLEKEKLSIMSLSTSGDKLHKMDRKEMKQLTPDELMQRFKGQERIEFGQAIQIIEDAKSILIREPNILRLEAPVVAVGDVHGQYYDLLSLLEEGGKPGIDETYLFLGDYVDRGSFSCEVMLLLLSLKIAYPDRVFLLRGNHECGSVSGHFGFKEECKTKYGVNVYYKFLLCFQTMPLAAVISTAYGDIFACHGGISPSLKTLEDIDRIDRFVEPETDPLLLDLLWADPMSDENVMEMNDEDYQSFMEVDWASNPARGCSYCFGYKALRQFLDDNKLVCLVRAHEVQKNGFKKHFDPIILEARMRDILQHRSASLAAASAAAANQPHPSTNNADLPPLITIFSAPNYCDAQGNLGAYVRFSRVNTKEEANATTKNKFDPSGVQVLYGGRIPNRNVEYCVVQFPAVPHPHSSATSLRILGRQQQMWTARKR